MPCDTDAASRQQRQFELELAVVSYADGPDRCTLFPPAAEDCVRMTTWLSANREVVEELEAMR